MAFNFGSKAATNVTLGSTPVRGLYYGSNLVWPPKMAYSTNFKFGQTGEQSIATASSNTWLIAAETVGTVVNQNGTVYTSTTGTDAYYVPYAYLATPMNKFELSASITIQDNLNAYKCGLVIGKPMSGDNFITLSFTSSQCWLDYGTSRSGRSGWDLTSDVYPVAKGDTVTVERDMSGTSIRLRIYVNGTLKKTFINTDLPIVSDKTNSNTVGCFVQYRRNLFSNYWGARLNGFEAHTF